MGIVLGSLKEQRKKRQSRIGVRQQIKVVAEVPAFTGRVPTDRAIRLRKVAIAVTVEIALLPAIAGMVGTEAGGSDNRSTVAGYAEVLGINHFAADGFIQEAGAVNAKQQAISFLIRREGNL